MLKKVGCILLGILFCQGLLISQTNEQILENAYTLGFSTYLSHTDKYALDFDTFSLEKIILTEIKQSDY